MKRGPLLSLMGLGLAALTLACGPAQQASQSGGSSGGGSGGPRSGGTLAVRIANDPFDWDMSYTGKSVPNGRGQSFAYNSLLGYKSGPDVKYEEQQLRGELAERWEVSPDGKKFTFHLRPGLKWAGKAPVNGREVTSADVKWSYEYWSRTGWAKDKKLPQGQFESMFEGMESVETPDASTVVVNFKQPFVPFLNYAAHDYNPIVPHEIYDLDGHLKDRIAGTGAFQLDEAASQKGSRWVWKKNPNYWDPGKPYIDEVRWIVVGDDAASIAAFQSKQIDYLTDEVFNFQTAQDFKKANPGATLFQYTNEGAQHVYMQTTKPPLNDVRVRRAVAFGIDRDELARVIAGGPAPWAPTGALLGLFTEEEAHQLLKYDPQEARRQLTEAGYDRLSMVWDFPGKAYGDSYVSTIELIQAQLKKVGIDLTLKSLEKDDFSANKKKQEFTINLGSSFCGESGDYDASIYPCYYSKSKANYGGINDPELDRLLQAQRAETDPAKRTGLLRDAVKRIIDNAYALDTYYPPRWQAWQPFLKNYAPNQGVQGLPLEGAWIEK